MKCQGKITDQVLEPPECERDAGAAPGADEKREIRRCSGRNCNRQSQGERPSEHEEDNDDNAKKEVEKALVDTNLTIDIYSCER